VGEIIGIETFPRRLVALVQHPEQPLRYPGNLIVVELLQNYWSTVIANYSATFPQIESSCAIAAKVAASITIGKSQFELNIVTPLYYLCQSR